MTLVGRVGTRRPLGRSTQWCSLLVSVAILAACGGSAGNGGLWSWGFALLPFARQLDTPSGVVLTKLAVGTSNAGPYGIALDTAGHAWSWGASVHGALGVAGVTGSTPPPIAVTMPAAVTFTAIATDGDHVAALDRTGHVWAWGSNYGGELGNGTTADSPAPVQVHMPAGVAVKEIATSFADTYALDTAGRIWAWGSNAWGGLGNGTVRHSGDADVNALPVAVLSPSDVQFVALAGGGLDGYALDANGRAWAWGDDSEGQLGSGPSGDSPSCQRYAGRPCSVAPTPVVMPAGVTFATLGAGGKGAYGLDASGHAWAWGSNQYGQLGIGTATGPQMCPPNLATGDACSMTPVPVAMPAGVRFIAISGSDQHSVALDSRGLLWGFGSNTNLELGKKTGACRILIAGVPENQLCSTTPVRITSPPGMTFGAIGAVTGFTLALSGKQPS